MFKKTFVFIATLALLLAMTLGAQASTYTLNTPGDITSCAPSSTITTSGFGGLTVDVWFFKHDPAVGYFVPIYHSGLITGDISIAFPYPAITGTMLFAARVDLLAADGSILQKIEQSWRVTCEETTPTPPPPPPPGDQGCTPGYWKNHLSSWVGFSGSSNYETVFGVDASFSPVDFLTVVNLGGGGEKALGRHAVAALLNAAHSGVNYPYSQAQIVAMVQQAYASGNFEGAKNSLDAANNIYCPLN